MPDKDRKGGGQVSRSDVFSFPQKTKEPASRTAAAECVDNIQTVLAGLVLEGKHGGRFCIVPKVTEVFMQSTGLGEPALQGLMYCTNSNCKLMQGYKGASTAGRYNQYSKRHAPDTIGFLGLALCSRGQAQIMNMEFIFFPHKILDVELH